jgi:hypothetical protein
MHDGRKLGLLTLIDEFTRQCLAIRIARRINGMGVIEAMADAMIVHGVPEHIHFDNGPEMTAKIVRNWLSNVGAKTLYIEPGSPWENGYCEGFNGKLRDEPLSGEIFYSLKEAKIVIEQWRKHYNAVRPHSSLGHIRPQRRGSKTAIQTSSMAIIVAVSAARFLGGDRAAVADPSAQMAMNRGCVRRRKAAAVPIPIHAIRETIEWPQIAAAKAMTTIYIWNSTNRLRTGPSTFASPLCMVSASGISRISKEKNSRARYRSPERR